MTNTTSEFGKELDSLADVITFGVAPSLLAFIWGVHFLPESLSTHLRQHLQEAGIFLCFLFLICGASRLARFNISHDAQAAQSGPARPQVFCGDADSGGGGAAGLDDPLLQWDSRAGVVGDDSMAVRGGAERVSDGEHVAVLVRQGD